ncbi:unnamed protein product [Clonostachys chloroleuca]|uniref:Major facilitator superfamily (MFS) profile domain-containing protein n=1 Tax=Clonostachys chloroleuca TaxID=1926264 RepID=A0AA35Q6B7_9HYPO|nr:unnamed protein product [Clonostachys chloroleuca]
MRLFIIIGLQIGVQLTGNTSMACYAPQIFSLVGAGQNSLLITGSFGVVKVISCLFFLLFMIERIGRRDSLFAGAFLMGSYMLMVAILTVKFPPDPTKGLTSSSIASLTMIYLEAMSYNISWGPVPWTYMGEIFPNRIREAGIAIGTSTQWLFNCVLSLATPYAVKNLGWKTFLMFGIFNYALVVFVFFFIKETKGKSLEEMEAHSLTAAQAYFLVSKLNPVLIGFAAVSFRSNRTSPTKTITRHQGIRIMSREQDSVLYHPSTFHSAANADAKDKTAITQLQRDDYDVTRFLQLKRPLLELTSQLSAQKRVRR